MSNKILRFETRDFLIEVIYYDSSRCSCCEPSLIGCIKHKHTNKILAEEVKTGFGFFAPNRPIYQSFVRELIAEARTKVPEKCDDCHEWICRCWACSNCSTNYTSGSCGNQCDSCEVCNDCCECVFCDRCSSRQQHWCHECETCESCCQCEDESSIIKDYSYRVEKTLGMRGSPKDKTFFGVELEVECSRESNRRVKAMEAHEYLQGFAMFKSDGSLDHGFEIVTAPATLEEHRKGWENFFANRPTGLRSYNTETCGMHIHISRPKPLHIGKILVFVNNPDNRENITKIAGRTSSRWAGYSAKELSDGRKPSPSRYEAVNIVEGGKTIELRIFKGTLKKESFFKNLEFAHALFYFTRDASYRELSWKDFWAFVLKNRKTYINLINFMGGTQNVSNNSEA